MRNIFKFSGRITGAIISSRRAVFDLLSLKKFSSITIGVGRRVMRVPRRVSIASPLIITNWSASTKRRRNATHTLAPATAKRDHEIVNLVTRRSRRNREVAIAKIIGLDIPVDLLRRFSHPAGSSSSAIAVVVFSDCFAALFPGTLSRQTPHAAITLNVAERRVEHRHGLPTPGNH